MNHKSSLSRNMRFILVKELEKPLEEINCNCMYAGFHANFLPLQNKTQVQYSKSGQRKMLAEFFTTEFFHNANENRPR